MQLTNIRLYHLETGTRLQGIAGITLDNIFAIHDIKIIQDNDGGFFLAMPSRKSPKGEFNDICHPISTNARRSLENLIIAAYKMMITQNADRAELTLKSEATDHGYFDQTIDDFIFEA